MKDNGEDELRAEYDFSKLKGRVRGKYVERYREGTNLVLLDPDVAAAFPDAKAVNDALRFCFRTSIVRLRVDTVRLFTARLLL